MWRIVVIIVVVMSSRLYVDGAECAATNACQCLAGYISCRGSIVLPDVLDSRLFPLREKPLEVADLRENALSYTILRRFLTVYSPTLKRVMLTDQLESPCPYMNRIRLLFPDIEIQTDCQVSLKFKKMKK